MRISNIRQFLGGADNVIAREVIQGDQLGFRFDLGETSLDGYTYEVDTELFRSELSSRGSNITINSFTKVTDNLVTEGKHAYTNLVTNAADNMSATLVVPSELLSNLTTANAPADSNTPFIVAMSVSLISPASGGINTKQSFRMLWIVRYRPIVSGN